ncbi:serine protease [Roseobacter sinensis]|uniref:Serine protease n=1 Tax=Roseobacter sinensis TaxID=2931391 RepID=A0ABT3B9W4_9RHOB|nr:serine protease [Roseobacter sp. WL0113]MCV3270367.1 serine protease [Roseobacter sp. WL0113]
MIRFLGVCVAVFATWSMMAFAQSDQEVVWVQIEAQPNLQDGLTRAEDYARALDDVNGFALGGGWYGILLGPYAAEDARQVLNVYRADGLIPRDSYIAFSSALGAQFFPAGADLLRRGTLTAEAAPALPQSEDLTPQIALDTGNTADPAEQQPAALVTTPDETPAQARQSERLLSAEERLDLQTALQWAGFYNAAIDGAFGRGTRNSMAAWQSANGFEPTGVLTTAQRAGLLGQYNAVLEGLDLRRVTDAKTGIEVKLPMARVAFDRYEAPFAKFSSVEGDVAQVLLISQDGNSDTLAGLYQVMQTLEIVPLNGERSLEGSSFVLIGRNKDIVSETRAGLEDGQIKGFTLIWPAGDEDRRSRLIMEMESSFTRLPGVLDPAAGDAADQSIDLVAGLQVRKPRLSRSGFFVDERGAVVTTADAVQSCTRITLDDDVEARLNIVDPDLGVAVLTPAQTLAPAQVAQFSPVPPRLQSDVAVAGYSYEGILDAPSVTFGTLADLRGLQGEKDLSRLNLETLPGDAGGPVFDTSGNVLGMLLPRGGGQRQLPPEVSFALAGGAIAKVLETAGIAAPQPGLTAAVAPEDITAQAVDMTVLVSCWE